MVNLWTHFVIGPMTWCLDEVFQFTGSYALAIILFTIFIKMVLYPLTIKQLKSQRAQQALQPQLQELRAKFGNDKVKLNEETMRLYKENNANPIAGCLPTVIQFPILIGLYNALYALIQQPGVHASFLWIKNLALPDFWSVVPPGTTSHVYNGLFILPLLAGALQWVQQRMMMNPAANQDPQQKMMNQMMQFMPLMVVFFGFRFPAGLALYWVTNTLVSIVQSYFIVGFGSLVLLVPALRRFSPRVSLASGQPALAGAGPVRPEKSITNAERRAIAARTAGSAPGRRTGAKSTPRPQESGLTESRNGQLKADGSPAGGRKGATDGERPRPTARKQGSKR